MRHNIIKLGGGGFGLIDNSLNPDPYLSMTSWWIGMTSPVAISSLGTVG